MKDNIGLQFVDTNILGCAHDISAGRKHEIAKKLLKDLWNKRNGCLSTQILSEFYVTITKKWKDHYLLRKRHKLSQILDFGN
ncbi:hypothetical protein [Thermoanaerobacterium thermosaccharolyticum]|uniref:hypothetical protein n=1 Tax=Thermoanaerobacterium thermosaccharolyticum TaxID=1517 RepID=UPI003D2E3B07